MLAALVLVYAGTAVKLVQDWSTNPNYSHGFLIPFAIAFFLWQERDRLARLPRRPSRLGLVLVVYSQAQYLLGVLGAERFLQATSFLFLAAGIIMLLWGWAHLKVVSFEFLLALVAIPLPAIIFNEIAFPLQLIASRWAAALLNFCGVPVFRSGNILQLPFRALDVAEACSGIRSLFSLLALALMVAYFLPLRRWGKTLFVLSAVPIAIVANAIRIAATGLLGQYVGQEYATGFFHEFSGWVIFVLAFGLLLFEAALLQRGRRHPPKGAA
ncbi:MAG: exosortase [Terriglobales bacterium]